MRIGSQWADDPAVIAFSATKIFCREYIAQLRGHEQAFLGFGTIKFAREWEPTLPWESITLKPN
jgi:hypothetical protein